MESIGGPLPRDWWTSRYSEGDRIAGAVNVLGQASASNTKGLRMTPKNVSFDGKDAEKQAGLN